MNMRTNCLLGAYLLLMSGVAQADSAICWNTIKDLAPGISENLSCVIEKTEQSFVQLCSLDGQQPTKEFRSYISYRNEYTLVQAEVASWLNANPGASQIPAYLSAKLTSAELDWMVPGRRSTVDGLLEVIQRKSASCN